jgi:hypothetical protein
MGKGGSRYGAGRPGWRLKAEHSLPLDIRTMQRAGGLQDGASGSWRWTNTYTGESAGSISYAVQASGVELRYSVGGDPRRQSIIIERTRCHFGGARPWFICPVRGERVAVLYMRAGRFACRHCQRIAYASQSDDLMSRAWRKQRKIENRLGPDCERPPGMHAATYDRLLSRINDCETVKDYALVLALGRMGLTL